MALSAITGCASISTFASFVAIPIGIMSSAIELKYKSIIQKKRKKHDNQIVFNKLE